VTREDAAGADRVIQRGLPKMISVIIANFNNIQTLPDQLNGLASQTYRGQWEVVVADNGSSDGSRELIADWESNIPGLRLIDASQRRGATSARNVGAASARGDFLLFIDADDVVEPEWLEAMAWAAGRADLVGGALDHDALNDQAIRGWRIPLQQERLHRLFGTVWVSLGANLGIWTSVFEDLGGWNADYLHGFEDCDLCWRAQLKGYHLAFAPDAVVQYRHRPRLRELARQHYEYGLEETRFYRLFRAGVKRHPNPGTAMQAWLSVLLGISDLLDPKRRGAWIRVAATHLGMLRGSIKYRVPYLTSNRVHLN
jgi:glycosyltransferase involved in cell wall biosynthesis